MIISIRKSTLLLLFLAGLLCVIGWGTQYYALVNKPEFFASKDSRGFIRYFYLAGEGNVPAWFQSTTIAICSLLVLAIGVQKREKELRFHWIAMAIMFLSLSVEETASILEGVGYRLQRVLPFSPTYLGIGVVGILAIGYWRFLLLLAPRSRTRFVVAGVIYLSGVMGLELIGSIFENYLEVHKIVYLTRTVLEEGLEFLGIILFVRALLLHVKEEAAEAEPRRSAFAAGNSRPLTFTVVD